MHQTAISKAHPVGLPSAVWLLLDVGMVWLRAAFVSQLQHAELAHRRKTNKIGKKRG